MFMLPPNLEPVSHLLFSNYRSHTPDENSLVEIYCKTESRSAGKEMELGSVMNRAVSNALKTFKLPPPKSCFIWRDGVGDNTISQVAAQLRRRSPLFEQLLQTLAKLLELHKAIRNRVMFLYHI